MSTTMQDSTMQDSKALYLGLDLSTQSLTAVAVDNIGSQMYTESVNFDSDLTHHKTPVYRKPPIATTRTTLFLEALDALFGKMLQQQFPFARVRGVSGAAQQHGSVYLTGQFLASLASLNSELSLLTQIPHSCFAFLDGPIWEDSSTREECAIIEKELGGAASMAAVTGARATLRFTGPQILARAMKERDAFDRVSRVALISAFLGSVLAGVLIPEDVAEASGTHLFDLRSDPPQWLPAAVRVSQAVGKLAPSPVHSYTNVGNVQSYFCTRYKIPKETPIIVCTGDNPASLSALPEFQSGDVLISLGTSDTAQLLLNDDELQTTEHGATIAVTFRSPLTQRPSYVRMLVYSNGALTREAVRNGEFCIENGMNTEKQSWEEFEKLVSSVPEGCTPPKVACFYLRPEITPRVNAEEHIRVYDAISGTRATASHAELCRLVLEWRVLALKTHMEMVGATSQKRILLTGGAAKSKAIPQVIADVMNAPVYKPQETASAALGAARRARVGVLNHLGVEADLAPIGDNQSLQLAAQPRSSVVDMYRSTHLPAYRRQFEAL